MEVLPLLVLLDLLAIDDFLDFFGLGDDALEGTGTKGLLVAVGVGRMADDVIRRLDVGKGFYRSMAGRLRTMGERVRMKQGAG